MINYVIMFSYPVLLESFTRNLWSSLDRTASRGPSTCGVHRSNQASRMRKLIQVNFSILYSRFTGLILQTILPQLAVTAMLHSKVLPSNCSIWVATCTDIPRRIQHWKPIWSPKNIFYPPCWISIKSSKRISKLQPTRCKVVWFIYFYKCSTCFRRFLRPSSGAQNCTYSFRYCHQHCC